MATIQELSKFRAKFRPPTAPVKFDKLLKH